MENSQTNMTNYKDPYATDIGKKLNKSEIILKLLHILAVNETGNEDYYIPTVTDNIGMGSF